MEVDRRLVDLASQVELGQRARSQLTQSGLCVLGARLVGADADDESCRGCAKTAESFGRLFAQATLALRVGRSPSCGGVLGVGAIEAAHHRADVAEIGTKHREIGVGEPSYRPSVSMPASA